LKKPMTRIEETYDEEFFRVSEGFRTDQTKNRITTLTPQAGLPRYLRKRKRT
jgi:hypothetical protein